MNKTLVFEGVENEIQYRFIASRYPDALIQGWYFSKALTRSELAKRLTGSHRNRSRASVSSRHFFLRKNI
jgi:sensor c-di-GMP phosphodiesterase-like protein